MQRTRGPLPEVLYNTALADPNWGYEQFGQARHGAARAWYSGSPAEVLGQIPVAEWTAKSSILFLWATFPKLDVAIDVMRAWGYELVTAFPWIKVAPRTGTLKRGIGFWGYMPAEVLLVCRRGRGRAPSYANSSQPRGKGSGADKPYSLLVGDRHDPVFYAPDDHLRYEDDPGHPVWFCPRGKHSRKPLSLYEWIESYFPGRYLELFARDTRVGWTCVGHETGWHLCSEGPIPYDEAVERGMVEAK